MAMAPRVENRDIREVELTGNVHRLYRQDKAQRAVKGNIWFWVFKVHLAITKNRDIVVGGRLVGGGMRERRWMRVNLSTLSLRVKGGHLDGIHYPVGSWSSLEILWLYLKRLLMGTIEMIIETVWDCQEKEYKARKEECQGQNVSGEKNLCLGDEGRRSQQWVQRKSCWLFRIVSRHSIYE